MKFINLSLCLALILCACASTSQPITKKEPSKSIDQMVDELLAKMTLEEKVGQMNQYNGFYDITGPVPEEGNAAIKYEHLRKGYVGSMLNVHGVEQVRKIQQIVVEESRLGIPLIFAFDVMHGYKTQSPIPLAESASWDMETIERSAQVAAAEAAAVGLNWTFAPMVDISRDARWGRVMEGAGEDPYLGSEIAKARVRGFQGDDLSATHTIAACAKHFAGYGFAEGGRDYNTTDVGTNTLYNMILPPFEATIEANVRTFMNGFNLLNGVPVNGDRFLQRDILKGKWDFDGFVVSDWGSIAEMIPHGHAADLADAANKAVIAGCDMDMEATAYVTHLVESVRSGAVAESLIDDAVRRILTVKYELGLFDDPYRYCDIAREQSLIGHPDHLSAVREMAAKSIVLLKNENKLLPLSSDQKGILVIGDLADDKNSPLGSWRLAADDHSAISVLEGIDQYMTDYTFVQGPKIFNDETDFLHHVDINTTDTAGYAAAIDAATKAETVIMVLGEHGYMSGEGRSRTDLGIPGLQQDLLKKVHAVNPNIILVLMNGRPLTLNWESENIPTILEVWQLGSESGNAIADVLFGSYNPSGKLPMSFPRSVGQLPLYYNHYSTGRPNEIPLVFWSHYGDEKNTPLYPFGYGLSYTTFDYSALSIDSSDPTAIKVSVNVQNTGDIAGEEVVQLYLQDPVSTIVRPVKELKGFQKIMLQPNQSKNVEFILTAKELGYYDRNYEWIVEPGKFNIMVGSNSVEGLTDSFSIN